MGSDADSPLSFNEAATTAAALAAAVVTLLRRVTRWLALTAPKEIECAWFRWVVGLGRGRERDSSWGRPHHQPGREGGENPVKAGEQRERTLNEAMAQDFLANGFFESPQSWETPSIPGGNWWNDAEDRAGESIVEWSRSRS